ncbi:hypothetical protein ACIA03_10915 [Nocardioides sp. NPDC051685]|uniref:hypothetical protein n=1 Tax=Nocardioides sp. NPDC051685 TaxID=3364334 RepID=UPI0037B7F299
MANELLRRRRQSMPSPSGSGEPMTRLELAEAVNRHIWSVTGTRSTIDVETIGRYERGQIQWPGETYRLGLRAVLGAGTDAELGFRPTRRGRAAPSPAAQTPETSSSRPHDNWLDALGPTTPANVGWPEVEFIRETTRVIATSENRFGGAVAAEMATAQLRMAVGLLQARAPIDVRRALFQAVGNLAGVVGFSAYDMNNYAVADRCYELALWCADEARSTSLRASVMADMARKTIDLGRPQDGLAIVDAAKELSGDLTATGQAMLSAWRARLLTKTGQFTEARTEVAISDEWFSKRDADQDPPWLGYYDEAEHQGSIGRTRLPLAQAGIDVDDTMNRLEAAVSLREATYVRSLTFCRIRLSTLLVSVGETDRATIVAQAALAESPSVRSSRMREEWAVLASAAGSTRSTTARELHHAAANAARTR